jgi:DNA-binding HxlR family transcriptional regulator
MGRLPDSGYACCELFERKWTAQIVATLFDGPQRFSAFTRQIGGLTDKVLSRRLAELEQAELISRTQYPEIPARVEYALTRAGRDLEPVIAAMERWSREHGVANEAAPR